MPFVEITFAEGRPPEKLRPLISAVTDAVCESIAAPKANVRVVIREVPRTHWRPVTSRSTNRPAQSLGAAIPSGAPVSGHRQRRHRQHPGRQEPRFPRETNLEHRHQ